MEVVIESPIASLRDEPSKVSTPAGWYRVASSADVTGETLHSLSFADSNLVAYRDRDDRVHIADARCPHNGVDLNCTNAPIEKGTIACPLHGWNFDTETGWCTLIPYNPRIVPKIRLSERPVHEAGGAVMLWWDQDGAEPASPPPAAP